MKYKLFLTLTIFLNTALWAKLQLPSFISDNMVLQQKTTVAIWGWEAPGQTVTVRTGWNSTAATAITDPQGRWQVSVQTPGAGGPYDIIIRGENEITIRNVLLGEVWFCSGQSNMEMKIRATMAFAGHPADRAELAAGDFTAIRMCVVQRQTSNQPEDTIRAQWQTATVEHFGEFSAAAYYFGLELYKKLHVPIGLIASSWGGTRIEYWTEPAALRREPLLASYVPKDHPKENLSWGSLYNGMVHPFLRYAIRGAIWYQGEANRADAAKYTVAMKTMIDNWRQLWNVGDFPFYYVQIAPTKYLDNYNSGFLYEAQERALRIPNTGMAATLDIGELNDIHPKNKRDVGKRLAYLALNKTYGLTDVACENPRFAGVTVKGKNAIVRLLFANGLHGCGTLPGFTIAGADGIFYPGQASIKNETIVVASPRVSKPKYVRYAFSNTDTASVFNGAGLPLLPFRNDTLPALLHRASITVNWDCTKKCAILSISGNGSPGTIIYTLDGSEPGLQSKIYKKPLQLQRSVQVRARLNENGILTNDIAAQDYTVHAGLRAAVTVQPENSARYKAAPAVLTDGLTGNANYRGACYCAYEGEDAVFTVDLGRVQTIHSAGIDFLRNYASWIFLPERVTVFAGTDSTALRQWGTCEPAAPTGREAAQNVVLTVKGEPVAARYIRVSVSGIKECPAWHAGAGQKGWIFCDEVIIR